MHRYVNACGAQSTTMAVFFNQYSWFLKHGCHSAWSSLILLGWLASESPRIHEFPPISYGIIGMCHRVMCSFLLWVLMSERGSSCLQSEHFTDWAVSPVQYLLLAPPRWPDLQHACLRRSTEETNAGMHIRWVSLNENSLSLSCLNTPVSASSSGVISAHCLSNFGGFDLRSYWLVWQALHCWLNRLHSSKMEGLIIHTQRVLEVSLKPQHVTKEKRTFNPTSISPGSQIFPFKLSFVP